MPLTRLSADRHGSSRYSTRMVHQYRTYVRTWPGEPRGGCASAGVALLLRRSRRAPCRRRPSRSSPRRRARTRRSRGSTAYGSTSSGPGEPEPDARDVVQPEAVGRHLLERRRRRAPTTTSSRIARDQRVVCLTREAGARLRRALAHPADGRLELARRDRRVGRVAEHVAARRRRCRPRGARRPTAPARRRRAARRASRPPRPSCAGPRGGRRPRRLRATRRPRPGRRSRGSRGARPTSAGSPTARGSGDARRRGPPRSRSSRGARATCPPSHQAIRSDGSTTLSPWSAAIGIAISSRTPSWSDSSRSSASISRKRSSSKSTRSILLTAKTMCGMPSVAEMNVCRRVCSITPLRASRRTTATSAVEAPVTMLRVYWTWPGASASWKRRVRRHERAVRDVDRDPLLALRAQAVGEQREVDVAVAAALARLLDVLELVGHHLLRVVEEAADQGRLAVVDGAARDEAQQLSRRSRLAAKVAR